MNKNIIIAILVIIIIAAAGFFLLGQSNGKMETQINIISDDTVQNGEQIQFELKDKQGNAISGENLNITFKNQKYTIPTDQNGKAALTIQGQSAGSYDVSAEFAGNDKYEASTAKAKITITDEEADNPATMTSGDSVKTTDDTNSNNNNGNGSDDSGQGLNNSPDNPFPGDPGTYCVPGYDGLWIKTSDNTVIDSPSGEGIGLDVNDWIATYGSKYHHDEPIDDNSTDSDG